MQFAGVEKRCGPREFLTFDRVEMLCATRSCFVNGRPSGLAQLILESLLKIIAKVIARRRGDLELFIFFSIPASSSVLRVYSRLPSNGYPN